MSGRAFVKVPDTDDSEEESSEDAMAGPKGPDPYKAVPSCLNLRCLCHGCYIGLFLLYIVIFPLWCKWLLTAPMPAMYWGQSFPDFPRMPLSKSTIAMPNEASGPQIVMTPIPTTPQACNQTCGTELHGYRSGEMNFDVTMRLNKPDLAGEVHSTYPVLLASADFKHWMLVADRRHAEPEAFFEDVDDKAGRKYFSAQDSCSKPGLTDRAGYIVACVSWTPGKFDALRDSVDAVDGTDLGLYCDTVGGSCGFPASGLPSDTLPSCDKHGVVNQTVLDNLVGGKNFGKVSINACQSATASECALSVDDMSNWPVHECEVHNAAARRLQKLDMPPGIAGMPTLTGDDPSTPEVESSDDAEDASGELRYRSLPRLGVTYEDVVVPQGTDILTSPKVYLLSSTSLAGPWAKLYAPTDPEADTLPPAPLGVKTPDDVIKVDEGEVRRMALERTNQLTLSPESCFGKRGPLYLVACAVNQSSYDDSGAWKNSKDQRFALGQKVMPPPFNDRCVAIAGRCGNACEDRQVDIEHCDAQGHINMDALTGEIPIQYNRKTPVFLFAYVLLFGFAVKVLMLCPGIFSPYPRCAHYSSELTEQLKYVLVVGVTGGGDEGKGTMLRNTVGMVSGLPPDCKCHFVVCNNEEGHRLEMMHCWEKFCGVLSAIPVSGGYEENLRSFTKVWAEETKTMSLRQVGARIKQLDPKIQAKLSGKSALEKAMKTLDWRGMDAEIAKLSAAIDVLHLDLGTNYNKFTPMVPQRDYVRDWVPPNPKMTALRMHFTSRAKPAEDARNIMVQHVAVGTWYYKKPHEAHPNQWLELRKDAHEVIYSQPDADMEGRVRVPLRSSHGKAGGLNFVDNYISIVYDHRPENQYPGDEDDPDGAQNSAPSLYAIADARHQFQPDFMISCIPCFFSVEGLLNKRVAFTQAPQHYPEYTDKYDYLDNNNAQFFRLNAMIRNCCGGVSSCGTNGMWQLSGDRDSSTIWQERLKRVRDRDDIKRTEVIEREQFHTSCKIEDTASSLDRVLVGEYSHFVNRKLSYGMSKDPEGFLGAQQRWVEGAITLCLQWITNNADAHGKAAKNQKLLWCVIIAFFGFVWSLCRMVTKQYTSSILVELGVIPEAFFDEHVRALLRPPIQAMYAILLDLRGGVSVNTYTYDVYEDMTLQFIVFMGSLLLMFLLLWLFTNFCRCCQKWVTFPYEMKWWGRLVISFDNLTYWIWFWTSFFWLGFNVYLATTKATFHFHNVGMMSFMLVATVLNYALIVSNALRFQVMESIDANEIAFLSMDNVWRANQLFFMVGPIQAFSVFTGTKNFLYYLFYGQDIGGWSGGDLTQVSIAIVKYWTTTIIFGAIACWIYLFASNPSADEFQSRRPGCIIFSFIAMDVLHPCVYLWTVSNTLLQEEADKMGFWHKAMSTRWWKKFLADVILNESLTNVFRYVAPLYNFFLPILVFYNAYFAVSGGFTLVAVGAGH